MATTRDTEQTRITGAGWDELERALRRPARGGTRGARSDRALRDYFGADELGELQELAERAAATRSRAPVRGNVVLLPGIMGSNLTCVETRDQDVIWVNLFRIANGRLEDLRLKPDGEREAKPGVIIVPTGIDKRTYAKAVLRLRARWNVGVYPFDWRKDVDSAAHGLAAFIRTTFKGAPVHLVAHSMGGLVARSFIRLHKRPWERMRGDGTQGGRLVMLGTPNFGSFAIPQVLTGVEKLVYWLSKLDLRHSLAEVVDVIATFLGSYCMLPAPRRLPADAQALYRRETWGRFPVNARHLERAREFHAGLEDPDTMDPAWLTYIAGCNRRTLCGLEVLAPGEFRYRETLDGDGRVTHELGRLERVPTWFADADHGGLPKHDAVLDAVEEILERGATALLPQRPPAARAALPAGGRWYRPVTEHRTAVALETLAKQAQAHEIDPEQQRVAEEVLLRAALGEARVPSEAPKVRDEVEAERGRTMTPPRRLAIDVVWGDATRVPTPVLAVGQYLGVNPVRASALGALDTAFGGFFAEAIASGMAGGELGQLFFAPAERHGIAPRVVVLAGMGPEGRFTRDDLRYLMMHVTTGVAALGMHELATVLIGAGAGNLSEDHALRGTLAGIAEALQRLGPSKRFDRVTLIELDQSRWRRLHEMVSRMQAESAIAGVTLAVRARRHPSARRRAAVRDMAEAPRPFGPRITVERDGDLFRFSALTEKAVVPTRDVEIQSFFPDGVAERLMASTGPREQQRLGRLLATTLLPDDFVDHLDTDRAVTLILDRSTAAIPWEMACVPTSRGDHAALGPDRALARQFRTLLSPAPGIAPQLNEALRVLVVADPAPEPEFQLPGAREEGRAVAATLSRIKHRFGLDIEVVDRIGDAECDPVDILGLILDGGFDVIHYAGHGVFDAERPACGGWVFGQDRYLGSREIFRARRVPRVVFANACFSSVVNPGVPLTAGETNRQMAGIAEAFFERGVQNYIGAGWPVQDDLAVAFATTFYTMALAGVPVVEETVRSRPARRSRQRRASPPPVARPAMLGEALQAARRRILHQGSTWGAYQHYGQATDALLRLPRRSG